MDKGGLWPPTEVLPAFRPTLESFAQKTHSIALILLASLAVSLEYVLFILYVCMYVCMCWKNVCDVSLRYWLK